MRFITKVWHPNVSSASGAICLDILKDQWSPALTLKTALLSLQALLSSPEPADPQVSPCSQAKQDLANIQLKLCTASFAEVRLCYFGVLQDAVVAKQYMSKNREFQRQAKDWTQTYAAKPSATDSRVCNPLTRVYLRFEAIQAWSRCMSTLQLCHIHCALFRYSN